MRAHVYPLMRNAKFESDARIGKDKEIYFAAFDAFMSNSGDTADDGGKSTDCRLKLAEIPEEVPRIPNRKSC